MAKPTDLSRAQVRRIAVASAGLGVPRPKRPRASDVYRVIRQLGLVQLDFVTSVVPAHYQVLFSRLGAYDRQLLDDAVYRSGLFTEQWAHEASIVPVESWPLLRYRRETHRSRPWGADEFLREHSQYAEQVLSIIRERGAQCADEMPDPVGVDRRRPDTWYRTVPRIALEAHFGFGLLAVRDRRPDFSRVYDLAERVVHTDHFTGMLHEHEAQRELLRQAARAYGVATAADLADYFRMQAKVARPRIEELRESGELITVKPEGWREGAYLFRGTRLKLQEPKVAALVSPFDPLVWYRRRVQRVFEFDFRFEIFVPDHLRKWGRYVLPFLLGDRLVARVDLKTERAQRRLCVQAAYLEKGISPEEVVPSLAGELSAWAGWLGLDGVAVKRRGDLSRALANELRRHP